MAFELKLIGKSDLSKTFSNNSNRYLNDIALESSGTEERIWTLCNSRRSPIVVLNGNLEIVDLPIMPAIDTKKMPQSIAVTEGHVLVGYSGYRAATGSSGGRFISVHSCATGILEAKIAEGFAANKIICADKGTYFYAANPTNHKSQLYYLDSLDKNCEPQILGKQCTCFDIAFSNGLIYALRTITSSSGKYANEVYKVDGDSVSSISLNKELQVSPQAVFKPCIGVDSNGRILITNSEPETIKGRKMFALYIFSPDGEFIDNVRLGFSVPDAFLVDSQSRILIAREYPYRRKETVIQRYETRRYALETG